LSRPAPPSTVASRSTNVLTAATTPSYSAATYRGSAETLYPPMWQTSGRDAGRGTGIDCDSRMGHLTMPTWCGASVPAGPSPTSGTPTRPRTVLSACGVHMGRAAWSCKREPTPTPALGSGLTSKPACSEGQRPYRYRSASSPGAGATYNEVRQPLIRRHARVAAGSHLACCRWNSFAARARSTVQVAAPPAGRDRSVEGAAGRVPAGLPGSAGRGRPGPAVPSSIAVSDTVISRSR
jgi:hypothetical protein